jgi:hypothetical protein
MTALQPHVHAFVHHLGCMNGWCCCLFICLLTFQVQLVSFLAMCNRGVSVCVCVCVCVCARARVLLPGACVGHTQTQVTRDRSVSRWRGVACQSSPKPAPVGGCAVCCDARRLCCSPPRSRRLVRRYPHCDVSRRSHVFGVCMSLKHSAPLFAHGMIAAATAIHYCG